jgi:hypothetical protein
MVLIASPVVFNLVFQLQTLSVKKEMKQKLQRLEKEQLVTLHLQPSEIHWYKQDKELQIGAELFDVKSITRKGDVYIVTGLFDKKEKELKRGLERLAKKDQKQKTDKLVSFLQLVYHQPSELFPDDLHRFNKKSYPRYSDNILLNAYPVIIPPPKFSLVV